jgi:cell division protein FtsB
MQKGIDGNSQVHISVQFLIKSMIGLSMLIAAYYNIQMKFASLDRNISDLEDKVTVLTASVEGMEQEHIKELEETVQEQKSLLQKIGLKK